MKKIFLILCFWCVCLHGTETDFDCIVIGTSPFSLFEAIYKRCLGNRVLVVEQGTECGGAWKSITICGVPHVDLGCHEFGRNPKLAQFLEEYAGCKIVGVTPDLQKPAPNGEFYPSQGCYELTHNLELLMQSLGVILLLNSKMESVFVDTTQNIAEVKINGMRYTTRKLVVTNNSEIKIENPQVQSHAAHPHTYYHIGMLVEDPTPPRFTYRNLHANGASRSTNYTPYSVELQGTGRQLITVQVHGEQNLANAEKFLEALKLQQLLDPNAKLLQMENYIYKQVAFNQSALHKLGPQAVALFEIINTGHITNLSQHIEKWKTVLKPWTEMMNPQLARAAG
ncbi:MAG TPA: FAD/NAD(P)-binding protein [Rhabdochlamydiaceae bacterium]|nr:FAD/NAD(P)-binding protein [Rhabdochlamydiaceae bacterium]